MLQLGRKRHFLPPYSRHLVACGQERAHVDKCLPPNPPPPGQLVGKKKLTEQDAADLARIRRILCIPGDAAADVRGGGAGSGGRGRGRARGAAAGRGARHRS